MIGSRWSVEDDALLTLEASQGIPYAHIAEHLGRTEIGVQQRARTLDVDYRRRRWTRREDADLRREYTAGADYGVIADTHFRSRNAIRIRLHQLELTAMKKETT